MKSTPGSHDKDRKQGKFGAPIPQPSGKGEDRSPQHAAAAKPDSKSDHKPGTKPTGKLPTPTHPPA
ncbi:hypothetical protein [Aquimonas sp.]|jgi:hypothetical protein|uniref:hypothetical protein n=1 Tax=Aquimonas sp. TaxID=1872588 RepID=UPI0037C0ABB1